MQLICDGQQTKAEVLDTSLNEYKEVFVKARREFATVIASVQEYLHGDGEAQEALRAATRGRGRGRGTATRGRGRAAPRDDGDDADDDDDDDPPPRGGARGRDSGRGRGSAASTRGGSRNLNTQADSGRAPKRRRTAAASEETTCECGDPAVIRTAGSTSANAGRQFYKCPKPQGEQCGFFVSLAYPQQLTAGMGGRQQSPTSKRSRTIPFDHLPLRR